MYLKHKQSGDLVEILDVAALADPCEDKVAGRFHRGEEMPEPENFSKSELVFPSNETLPACWTNPDYRS